MFLKLYWLGAALALMLLLLQPQAVNGNELFPYVPNDINATTFPINLNATTNSDMVLVKCPDRGYKHKHAQDEFIENKFNFTLFNQGEPNLMSNWIPLVRELNGPTEINCGRSLPNHNNGLVNSTYWIFNVMWEDSAIENIRTDPLFMNSPILETHPHCHLNPQNIFIISKKKKSSMLEKIIQNKIENPYTNQMVYYFVKPQNGATYAIKKPCFMYRLYGTCPIFDLPGRAQNSIINENEVKKVKIDNLNGQKEKVKVNLVVNNKKEFYRDEEISLSRMRYTENGTKVIEGSTMLITSSFIINGFDLVKLVYNCWNGAENENVSQTYYFGPIITNHTQDKTEEISANDTSIKVKCDTTYLNVGYLKEVEYNGTHANVSDLESSDSLRGKF
uniref:Glycoprotein n=1 Tax=Strongyloides papillosus TaxID=174720 RepID=A0A0N5CI71_STREA